MLIKTEPYYQRARAHDSSDLSVSRFFFFLLFFSLSLSPLTFCSVSCSRKEKKKKRRGKKEERRRAFSRRNSNPFLIFFSLLTRVRSNARENIFRGLTGGCENMVLQGVRAQRYTHASCCRRRQGAGPGYSVAGRFSNYCPVVGRPEGLLTSSERTSSLSPRTRGNS